MLIASPRHTAADLRTWEIHEETDRIEAERTDWQRECGRAIDMVRLFVSHGPCYAGVSWGKDSIVVAHLIAAAGLDIPLVCVRRTPIDNPDCWAVRDAFLARWPMRYHEVVVECERDPAHPLQWWTRGVPERTTAAQPKQVGFARAAEVIGSDRYVSGVRAEESGARVARMRRYGTATERTCAPIGWWPASRVFAYLHHHALPVHPAYACTLGGRLDRTRLRVGSLGGPHGQGHGRREWETRYYRDEMRVLA